MGIWPVLNLEAARGSAAQHRGEAAALSRLRRRGAQAAGSSAELLLRGLRGDVRGGGVRAYSVIPTFRCRPGCHDCCGPVPWSRAEHRAITAWLRARGQVERKATSLRCPYIEKGGCAIYEVRPFLCRLYGTVPKLSCPHGCRPALMLPASAEDALVEGYLAELRLGG